LENTGVNSRVENAIATLDLAAGGSYHMPLGGILFIAIFVTLFGCLLLFLASKLGRRSYDPVKFETYECGIPVQEKKDTKISVKFYLTAILFIIFDIEIIFMYPWATTFRDFISSGQGLFVLISMMVFLAVFIFGLFWEVKSKALEWD
jgi:NADH-quinone oxidoreductase subunit A